MGVFGVYHHQKNQPLLLSFERERERERERGERENVDGVLFCSVLSSDMQVVYDMLSKKVRNRKTGQKE